MWSYIYPDPEKLKEIIKQGIYYEMPRDVPVSVAVTYKPYTDLEIEVTITAPEIKLGIVTYGEEKEIEEPYFTRYPSLSWTMYCRLDMESYSEKFSNYMAETPIISAVMKIAKEFLRTYFDTERY